MAKVKAFKKKVDFTDVDLRGNMPEGTYVGPLTHIEHDEKNDALRFVFNVGEEGKAKRLTHYLPLQDSMLWKLRQCLEGLGIETPDSKFTLDTNKILSETEDNEYQLEVTHRDYRNRDGESRTSMEVAISLNDSDDEDEDDGEDEVDIDNMDADELRELVSEKDLDVDVEDKALKGKGKKKLEALRDAVKEALEGDDDDEEDGEDDEEEDDDENEEDDDESEEEDNDDEEDEEDDDDSETYSRDDVNKMKSKELAELVESEELDVELDGTLKQNRKTVWAAIEEAGLSDD